MEDKYTDILKFFKRISVREFDDVRLISDGEECEGHRLQPPCHSQMSFEDKENTAPHMATATSADPTQFPNNNEKPNSRNSNFRITNERVSAATTSEKPGMTSTKGQSCIHAVGEEKGSGTDATIAPIDDTAKPRILLLSKDELESLVPAFNFLKSINFNREEWFGNPEEIKESNNDIDAFLKIRHKYRRLLTFIAEFQFPELISPDNTRNATDARLLQDKARVVPESEKCRRYDLPYDLRELLTAKRAGARAYKSCPTDDNRRRLRYLERESKARMAEFKASKKDNANNAKPESTN